MKNHKLTLLAFTSLISISELYASKPPETPRTPTAAALRTPEIATINKSAQQLGAPRDFFNQIAVDKLLALSPESLKDHFIKNPRDALLAASMIGETEEIEINRYAVLLEVPVICDYDALARLFAEQFMQEPLARHLSFTPATPIRESRAEAKARLLEKIVQTKVNLLHSITASALSEEEKAKFIDNLRLTDDQKNERCTLLIISGNRGQIGTLMHQLTEMQKQAGIQETKSPVKERRRR